MILNGPTLKAASGNTKSIMLLLHGVGSNGDDLISLAPLFAEEYPDTLFVSPNAPEAFPQGFGGYQWFPYWDRTHQQIIDGVEKAAAIVGRFIQELLDANNLTHDNLVIAGFSQGAMVSLQTALTMQDNCAGVISFSGGLLKVDITKFEIRSQPPVCLIHGEDDDVVPYTMSETSANILNEMNVPCEFHKIKHLGHSIDMNAINIAKGFLQKILK